MRLTFLRHGETELNREKKVQGWSDSQLTATAVEKTVQCANYLKTLMDGPFDLGATSDTIRAYDTCRLIFDEFELPNTHIHKLKLLREYHYGSFESKPDVEMTQQVTAFFKKNYSLFKLLKINRKKHKKQKAVMILNALAEIDRIKRPHAADPSETAEQFTNRVKSSLKELRQLSEKGGYQNILVISHGHFLMSMLGTLFENEVYQLDKLANLEGFVVEYDNANQKFVFVKWLRGAHE